MTNPVHVGRTLESLRNSDFDTLSAMGEVIDNSIQANAKNIRIRIKKKEVRKNRIDLTEVAFADDGDGMNREILSKCLQLGFSDRYNDRDGIGRFGVGMTLGAVTQCTRIEVYSKPRGGGWNSTYIDLNEMKDKEDAIIQDPTPDEIPREYADMIENYGTLVIWKNWDREDAKVEEMEVWIGRTYRKFIGKQIIDEANNVIDNPNQRHIFLDDQEVSALDPLYVTKTDYNDEVTKLETPITITESLHEFDRPPKKSVETSEFTIRMSLLPEKWRQKSGTGNSAENRQRHVPDNEGISILRNGREVFYGPIPYYRIKDDTSSHYKGFIDLDRFWGCEISFNADMDHWFSIKNIKVGARPLPELREKIEKEINPTIQEFRKEIREFWKSEKNKERKGTSGEITGTDEAEQVIGEGTRGSRATPSDITDIIKESGEIKRETEAILTVKLANNPVSFLKKFDMDARGSFIDIISKAGTILININMNHPFFQKFFDLRDRMITIISTEEKNSGEVQEKIAQDIETNLHIMLASFALAKRELNTTHEEHVGETMDKLMHNWTYYLNKYTKHTLEDNE